ncbi:MAG: hypothetical protein IJC83_06120 [Oscillospiraceae bacterium]|nr:hypothetical protein [Oscillospiraceae bacterium]
MSEYEKNKKPNDNPSCKNSFAVDADKLVLLASIFSVYITKNLTKKEIDTLINFTALVTKNLYVISAQKNINKRLDKDLFW